MIRDKQQNQRRLEAQRNALNAQVRALKEELMLLQEPASYVGEVVKMMGKNKVLVKVNPEGKYVILFGFLVLFYFIVLVSSDYFSSFLF